MANLFFPQLTSGCIAQYPLRKTRLIRSVKNVLADGTVLTYADRGASKLIWGLTYSRLSEGEAESLRDFHSACAGRFRPFTFIDPTDNMLTNSSNLLAPEWRTSPGVSVSAAALATNPSNNAWVVTNYSGSAAEIWQSQVVPTNYVYSFSVYAMSAQTETLTLLRRGVEQDSAKTFDAGPKWERLVTSGSLAEAGQSMTAVISLLPGQQIYLSGPQLEAQGTASAYRATSQSGGVYANVYWASDELELRADAPGEFSTSFSIETAI